MSYGQDPKTIPQNVNNILDDYLSYVEEKLQDISTRRQIHHDIVITCQEPYQTLFVNTLHKSFKHLLGKDVRIMTIRPDLVSNSLKGSNPDIYIALSARFFHKLQACGE